MFILFPKAQCDVFKLFFCAKNKKHSPVRTMNDTEKQQILTFKRHNQQFFLLFYLKNN